MLKSLCLLLRLCSDVSGHAYVQDGDTIYVENAAVRIMGIDAEELSELHGYAAKNQMIRLIGGNDVTCKLNGEKSYNRYVGTCFVNGSDLAEGMVKSGMALDCARYSKSKYRAFEPQGVRQWLRQKPYC